MSAMRILAVTCCVLGTLAVGAPLAHAAPDLTPTPASYDFGSQDVHSPSSPQNFTFQNTSGASVFITRTAISGADASMYSIYFDGCDGATLNVGDSCYLQVEFAPTVLSSTSASLDVTNDFVSTASVPMTGTGATGTLTPGTSPLTFGPQPWYYGSMYNNVTVFNNTTFGVNVSDVSITGADASLFTFSYNGCTTFLYAGQNCNVSIYFNPTGPMTANAQLELTNDGTTDPLVVPLQGVALSGGAVALSPASWNFGPVAIGGQSAAKTMTITNGGDAAFAVQQMFVTSGSPQYFPITNNGCVGTMLSPGDSCHFDVTFQPGTAGEKEAAVFMIAGNLPQPVVILPISGQGSQPLSGTAVASGTPEVGQPLTCETNGLPSDATDTYQWLANGTLLNGQTGDRYTPTDAVIGQRISCRVTVTNAAGSQTIDSPASGPVQPRTLSGLSGAESDSEVCRAAQTVRSLKAGGTKVSIDQTRPVTPQAPLTFKAGKRTKLALSVGGKQLASGTGSVSLTPRQLSHYPNGSLDVAVKAGRSTATTRMTLSNCALAVSLTGGPRQTTRVNVSARQSVSSVEVRLPRNLTMRTPSRAIGQITVRSYGSNTESFPLFGRRSSSNGINVSLSRRTIKVTGLPTNTGVVSVSLDPRIVRGRAGQVTATSRATFQSSISRNNSARTPAVWLR